TPAPNRPNRAAAIPYADTTSENWPVVSGTSFIIRSPSGMTMTKSRMWLKLIAASRSTTPHSARVSFSSGGLLMRGRVTKRGRTVGIPQTGSGLTGSPPEKNDPTRGRAAGRTRCRLKELHHPAAEPEDESANSGEPENRDRLGDRGELKDEGVRGCH